MSNYFEVRFEGHSYTPEALNQGSLKQHFGGPLFFGRRYEKVDFGDYIALDFRPTVTALRRRLNKLRANPLPIKQMLGDESNKAAVTETLRRYADFIDFYQNQFTARKKPFIRLLTS